MRKDSSEAGPVCKKTSKLQKEWKRFNMGELLLLAPALNSEIIRHTVHLSLLCCVMAAMTRQTENTLELWSGIEMKFPKS